MTFGKHAIGICDWTLKAGPVEELVSRLRTLGLSHVQIALAHLVSKSEVQRKAFFDTLADAGISVTAGQISFPGENYASIATIQKTGGFVPSDTWPARRELALAAGKVAAAGGLSGITMHLGFIPPSNDPAYKTIVARAAEVATAYAAEGIDLLLETGQEKAHELLRFLNDLNIRNVGVNFDPANMILYGAGEPIEAVTTLGRHIRHVHIKDAVQSPNPGVEWGKETPFGSGDLDGQAFLFALANVGYAGPLVIEREAVSTVDEDVTVTLERLSDLISRQA